MALTYAILTLAYLEKLYEIIGKNNCNDIKEFTKTWKRYLDDTKHTPKNKIYYSTQLKRTTILRQPYKNVRGVLVV